MLEKHPLFLFIIKMLIAILYKQFDTYTVVQNNSDIVQSIDIYRGYRSADYFISVLFNKIPFIVIFFCFTVPTLVIQSCYKNIIIANNASKALGVECILFKTKHHHFACHIQRI